MHKFWISIVVAVGLVTLVSGWYIYNRFFQTSFEVEERKVRFFYPTNQQQVDNHFLVLGDLSFSSSNLPRLWIVASNSTTTDFLGLTLSSNLISNNIILSNKGIYFLRIGLDDLSQRLYSSVVSIQVTNQIKDQTKVIIIEPKVSRPVRVIKKKKVKKELTEDEKKKIAEEQKRREDEKQKKEVEKRLNRITNEVERIKKEQEFSVNDLAAVELEEQRAKSEEISNQTKKIETELSQKAALLSNENISRAKKEQAQREMKRLAKEKRKQEEKLKKQAEELKKKEGIAQERQVEDDFYVFDSLDQLKDQVRENTNINETKEVSTNQVQAIATNEILTNVQTNILTNNEMGVSEKNSSLNQVPGNLMSNQVLSNETVSNVEPPKVKKTAAQIKAERIKALILKKRGFSNIKLDVKDIKARYRLFVNGNLIKVLSGGESFDAEVIAGEKYDVVLIKEDDLRPVFRKVIDAKREETYDVHYIPMGEVKIDIRQLNQEAILKVDNKEVARIPKLRGKEKFIENLDLTSYEKHRIDIVSLSQELLYRQFIDPIESITNKIDLDMGPKVRNLYFALRALEGGPTAVLGVNIRWMNILETWITGGIFFYDPLFYTANIDIIYFFYHPKQSYFKVGADIFVNYYLATAGKTLSSFNPGLGIVVRYDWFYVFLKVRYSLIDNGFHPMIGLGLSF